MAPGPTTSKKDNNHDTRPNHKQKKTDNYHDTRPHHKQKVVKKLRRRVLKIIYLLRTSFHGLWAGHTQVPRPSQDDPRR